MQERSPGDMYSVEHGAADDIAAAAAAEAEEAEFRKRTTYVKDDSVFPDPSKIRWPARVIAEDESFLSGDSLHEPPAGWDVAAYVTPAAREPREFHPIRTGPPEPLEHYLVTDEAPRAILVCAMANANRIRSAAATHEQWSTPAYVLAPTELLPDDLWEELALKEPEIEDEDPGRLVWGDGISAIDGELDEPNRQMVGKLVELLSATPVNDGRPVSLPPTMSADGNVVTERSFVHYVAHSLGWRLTVARTCTMVFGAYKGTATEVWASSMHLPPLETQFRPLDDKPDTHSAARDGEWQVVRDIEEKRIRRGEPLIKLDIPEEPVSDQEGEQLLPVEEVARILDAARAARMAERLRCGRRGGTAVRGAMRQPAAGTGLIRQALVSSGILKG